MLLVAGNIGSLYLASKIHGEQALTSKHDKIKHKPPAKQRWEFFGYNNYAAFPEILTTLTQTYFFYKPMSVDIRTDSQVSSLTDRKLICASKLRTITLISTSCIEHKQVVF
jgi:hypothetical protein